MKAGKTVTEFPIDFDKVGQIIMIAIGMYVISAIFNFFATIHHDPCITTDRL